MGKRLQQELMTLMMSGDKGISAILESDSLFKWIGTIRGTAGTVYEDLRYKLSLEFPSGYPYNAPTVKFLTPCYHPNVDTQRTSAWTSSRTSGPPCMTSGPSCCPSRACWEVTCERTPSVPPGSHQCCRATAHCCSPPAEPNIDSPLNTHAAELWKNPTAFKKYLQETYSKQVSSQDP